MGNQCCKNDEIPQPEITLAQLRVSNTNINKKTLEKDYALEKNPVPRHTLPINDNLHKIKKEKPLKNFPFNLSQKSETEKNPIPNPITENNLHESYLDFNENIILRVPANNDTQAQPDFSKKTKPNTGNFKNSNEQTDFVPKNGFHALKSKKKTRQQKKMPEVEFEVSKQNSSQKFSTGSSDFDEKSFAELQKLLSFKNQTIDLKLSQNKIPMKPRKLTGYYANTLNQQNEN